MNQVHCSWQGPTFGQQFFEDFAVSALKGLFLVRTDFAPHFTSHRAWMARMSATTLTPLTQRTIFPLFAMAFGIDGMATFWQLFVSAAWIGWGINLTVAEAWIRGRRAARLAPA